MMHCYAYAYELLSKTKRVELVTYSYTLSY